MRQHPDIKILEAIVRQSSDAEFHCYTMVLLCHEEI
jgi:hypothetical protein